MSGRREPLERTSMLAAIHDLVFPEILSPPGASTKLLVEILLAAWKENHADLARLREAAEQVLADLDRMDDVSGASSLALRVALKDTA